MMDNLVQKTISKYEYYMTDVLHENMKKILIRLHLVNTEINNLNYQKQTMNRLTSSETKSLGFQTHVDIGCNFYLDAVVSDTSTMLIHIGLNHFLELSVDEANEYLSLRLKALERKAEELKDQSNKTSADIEHMLTCIAELQNKLGKKNGTNIAVS